MWAASVKKWSRLFLMITFLRLIFFCRGEGGFSTVGTYGMSFGLQTGNIVIPRLAILCTTSPRGAKPTFPAAESCSKRFSLPPVHNLNFQSIFSNGSCNESNADSRGSCSDFISQKFQTDGRKSDYYGTKLSRFDPKILNGLKKKVKL